MATQSFFEDLIIDDAESSARLEELFREHPVVKTDPNYVPLPLDDPEVLRGIEETLRARKAAREAADGPQAPSSQECSCPHVANEDEITVTELSEDIDASEALTPWDELFREHPVVKTDPNYVPLPLNDPDVLRGIEETLRARKAAREAQDQQSDCDPMP